MKLYNSYCYADISAVNDSVSSSVFIGDGTILTSTQILNADQISLTYSAANKSYTSVVGFPDCTSLGFDNSYTGVSISDAVEVSSLVILMFVIAFKYRMMKRVF